MGTQTCGRRFVHCDSATCSLFLYTVSDSSLTIWHICACISLLSVARSTDFAAHLEVEGLHLVSEKLIAITSIRICICLCLVARSHGACNKVPVTLRSSPIASGIMGVFHISLHHIELWCPTIKLHRVISVCGYGKSQMSTVLEVESGTVCRSRLPVFVQH